MNAKIMVAAASLLCGVAVLAGEAVKQVVTPEETDEILANPGMGWETFYRTSKQDKCLPSWIPSTVHYIRWDWGQLEPQPGKLNTDFLDKALKETRESGQKLAFRVMCCSTEERHPYHPRWLKEIGGKELIVPKAAIPDYEGRGPLTIPDMDDPVLLNAHLDFIKRLGERYDGQLRARLSCLGHQQQVSPAAQRRKRATRTGTISP